MSDVLTELAVTATLFFCIRCISKIVVFLLDDYVKHVQMKFNLRRYFSFFLFFFFFLFLPEIRKELARIYKIFDSLHIRLHEQKIYFYSIIHMLCRVQVFFNFFCSHVYNTHIRRSDASCLCWANLNIW